MVNRRTPKVEKKYEEIGGSPIRKWHDYQAEKLQQKLDDESPESAPHKVYVAFRYTAPSTEECLLKMKSDGVTRAVAFPTYPQWSCTTSGSSMNELWRTVERLKMENDFQWSVLDRWYEDENYHKTMLEKMAEAMTQNFDENVRNETVILFSAHSLPMKVVEKGDQYVSEIGATAKMVMQKLPEFLSALSGEKAVAGWNGSNPHYLTWQSKVGPLPWMVPKTEEVIKSLGRRGVKNVLVVPIAFVCDHIETLHEVGIEYKEDADKAGISNFHYTEGFNGSETFTKTLSNLVQNHLKSGGQHSNQYKLKCLDCEKPYCRRIINEAKLAL